MSGVQILNMSSAGGLLTLVDGDHVVYHFGTIESIDFTFTGHEKYEVRVTWNGRGTLQQQVDDLKRLTGVLTKHFQDERLRMTGTTAIYCA